MDIRQTREAVDTLLARGYIEVIDDGWYRVNPAAVTPIEEA
jgi:predicted transcriptional regulator of viral defense system